MAPHCLNIAPPERFGENPYYRELAVASPDGGPEIDTCDLEAQLGKLSLQPETVVKLFRDEQGQLLPRKELQHRLRFFGEYPRQADQDRVAARIEAVMRFDGQDEPSVARIRAELEQHYSALSRARAKHQLPDFPEEMGLIETVERTAMALGRGDIAFEIIGWACSSRSFAGNLLSAFAESAVRVESSPAAQQLKQAGVETPFARCFREAPPERRAGLLMLKQELEAKIKVIPPSESPPEPPGLKVGDVITQIPSVQAELGASLSAHTVSVLYFWHSQCEPCHRSEASLFALAGEMQNYGGQVIGIIAPDDTGEKFDELRTIHVRQWKDVRFGEATYRQLNPAGVVPIFVIVDRAGKVLAIHRGGGEGVGDALRQELKQFRTL